MSLSCTFPSGARSLPAEDPLLFSPASGVGVRRPDGISVLPVFGASQRRLAEHRPVVRAGPARRGGAVVCRLGYARLRRFGLACRAAGAVRNRPDDRYGPVPFPRVCGLLCRSDLSDGRRSALPVLDPDFPFRRETGFLIRWPGTTGFLLFSASFFAETVAFGLSGYGKLRELVSAAGGRGVSPNRKAGKYPEQCPESRGAGMAVSEEAEPVPVGRSLLSGAGKRARAGTGLLGRRRECRGMPPVGRGSSRRSPNRPGRAGGEWNGPYMFRDMYGPYADDCRRRVSLRP